MTFTFTLPNWELAHYCKKKRYQTVEAVSVEAAREKAMNEWFGPPIFGLLRWTGRGLILEICIQ